jgi:hypothetical protein
MARVVGLVESSLEPVSVARIDPATGILRERGHPLDGRLLAGKVLAFPGGKGSSSGSYVLLNLARRGLAPCAIAVQKADAVLVAGAVLSGIPLLQGVDPRSLRQGERFAIDDDTASPPAGMALDEAQCVALDGNRGRAQQLAMRILVAAGEACGADALIPVASAHVGLSLASLGEAGVELLESLAAEGARFAVPATTNVLSFERGDDASAEARLQRRALDALLALGASPNCSCNPFVQGFGPRRGETVAWSESATAPFVNGVLGARTNREGATSLASALAGLTPRYGMHLDRERAAGPLYRVEARLDSLARYHLLGAAVGRRCGGAVPALAGLRGPVSRDALYGFSAALAAHSTAAMFHAAGITPEATDLATLYPCGVPEAVVIGEAELAAEQARWAGDGSPPDFVVIGCPHASLEQLEEVADMVSGATVRPGTAFLLHTNREMKEAAARTGALTALTRAGVRVTSDTCAYVSLESYAPGARVLTDSAKMAFLMATRGLRPEVAGLRECVYAALRSS